MFHLTPIIMALFAYSFASFQETIIKAFINYVPPYGNKVSKNFHGYGFAIAFIVGLSLSLKIDLNYLWQLANLILNGLTYSLVFDLSVGSKVFGNPFYLGKSSRMDKAIKNGKRKAIVLVILILGINALKIFL